MALEYLRQNLINDLDQPVVVEKRRPLKRLCKRKFSLLLGGNLVVWMMFIVSVLDLNGFSAGSISLPKIPQKLSVAGIVYNEKSPSAIISKQVYKKGDVVDGYTIVDISRNVVKFQKDDEIITRQVR